MSILPLKYDRGSAARVVVYITATLLLISVVSFAVSDSVRFIVCRMTVYGLYGSPTEKDREDAEALFDRITSVHHFVLDSRSVPGRPPVFFNAGSRLVLTNPTRIEVYDILDKPEQDRIVTAVQEVVRIRNLRPVEVRFLVYENWTQNGGLGTRGSETQMRLVRVDAQRITEKAGGKQIDYPNLSMF